MTLDLELAAAVGESADRLISVQVYMSGGSAELTSRNITKGLYDAARAQSPEPLVFGATKSLLDRVKPRDTVVFCTGFFDPPSMVDEADGPIGVVHLARAMCAMLDITPVFLTEVANLGRMEAMARAAGLDFAELELARMTPFKAVMVALPIDPDTAAREARTCLDQLRPSALIAIEKPAPCPKGRYHTGVGLDVTDVVGKVDHIFQEARPRGILTIGIGDGGNEVGMGNILEAIHQVVPTGPVIGTSLGTDLLVVAAIANWGAYAIEACLAAALHMPEAIHTRRDERRVCEAAAVNGLIDPATGVANGWVDGTPPVCSESMLELLRQMVTLRLMRKTPHSLMNFPRRWAERSRPDDVLKAWSRTLLDAERAYFSRPR